MSEHNTLKSKLFLLHPEVAGGLGPETIIANQDGIDSDKSMVPEIAHLDYQFEGWLGDDLLETFPCFIVTERLANALANTGLTGVRLDNVTISVTEEFEEFNPDAMLPVFCWLIPEGKVNLTEDGRVLKWSGHDVNLDQSARLLVTEKCLEVLLRHTVEQCEIEELDKPAYTL